MRALIERQQKAAPESGARPVPGVAQRPFPAVWRERFVLCGCVRQVRGAAVRGVANRGAWVMRGTPVRLTAPVLARAKRFVFPGYPLLSAVLSAPVALTPSAELRTGDTLRRRWRTGTGVPLSWFCHLRLCATASLQSRNPPARAWCVCRGRRVWSRPGGWACAACRSRSSLPSAVRPAWRGRGALPRFSPVTLRPRLSAGLPLSGYLCYSPSAPAQT
jgi:hypothetical protein